MCQVPDLGGLTLGRAPQFDLPEVATRTTIRLDVSMAPALETARSGLGAAEYETDLTAATPNRRRIHNVHPGLRDTAALATDRRARTSRICAQILGGSVTVR